jgi:hypothetical protein
MGDRSRFFVVNGTLYCNSGYYEWYGSLGE